MFRRMANPYFRFVFKDDVGAMSKNRVNKPHFLEDVKVALYILGNMTGYG